MEEEEGAEEVAEDEPWAADEEEVKFSKVLLIVLENDLVSMGGVLSFLGGEFFSTGVMVMVGGSELAGAIELVPEGGRELVVVPPVRSATHSSLGEAVPDSDPSPPSFRV